MIIDTHSQLWTKEALETFPPSMLSSYEKMFKGIRTFELEDILADMDQAGVDMAVLVAIDAETTYHYKVPNELVAQAVARYPRKFIGFAGVDPGKGVLAVEEVRRSVEELGLKGLKFVSHLHEMPPNDPRMYPILEEAQRLNIPVLFHTGVHFHTGARLKYCRPEFLDDIAIDFPDLKIVAAHFGFPWFHEALSVVQKNANLYFNIAGWAPRHIPEYVIKLTNGPLSDRALLGSDFPLISRVRIMKELRELPIKESTLQKLISENPRRLLGLEGRGSATAGLRAEDKPRSQ
jgi:predicted TIM-barrel fold metal-dependent hydrolase